MNPPSPPENNGQRYVVSFVLFIGLFTVFRLIYAAHSGMDLAPDESYYWDWSRRLDWGYYSKPPMIAWVYALVTWIGGSTTFAVRAGAALIMAGTMTGLFFFARAVYSSRVAFWTVAAASFTPGMAAAATILTIDSPLLLFWAWTAYFTYRALTGGSFGWWIAAGLAMGGGMLSKQVMIGFAPLTALALWFVPGGRRKIFSPGFILFTVLGFSMLLPPILWNLHHHWITFQHTAHHVQLESGGHLLHPSFFFEYLGGQAGVTTPVLFAMLWFVCWKVAKHHAAARELRVLYPALLCYPALVGFQGLSILSRVEPNWPAPFYLTGMALTTGWALGALTGPFAFSAKRKRVFRAALIVGAIFTFFTYFPGTLGWFGFPISRKTDPTFRLLGWSNLGKKVSEVKREIEEKRGWEPGSCLVLSDRREIVSQLAFYMPEKPRTMVWPVKPGIHSQYELWGGLESNIGRNAIFVTPHSDNPAATAYSCFRDIAKEVTFTVPLKDGVEKEYTVFVCTDLLRPPHPR